MKRILAIGVGLAILVLILIGVPSLYIIDDGECDVTNSTEVCVLGIDAMTTSVLEETDYWDTYSQDGDYAEPWGQARILNGSEIVAESDAVDLPMNESNPDGDELVTATFDVAFSNTMYETGDYTFRMQIYNVTDSSYDGQDDLSQYDAVQTVDASFTVYTTEEPDESSLSDYVIDIIDYFSDAATQIPVPTIPG